MFGSFTICSNFSVSFSSAAEEASSEGLKNLSAASTKTPFSASVIVLLLAMRFMSAVLFWAERSTGPCGAAGFSVLAGAAALGASVLAAGTAAGDSVVIVSAAFGSFFIKLKKPFSSACPADAVKQNAAMVSNIGSFLIFLSADGFE